ncbi:MAG: hypothetical protein ABR501_04140 [Pyrinomonadaceae bacterium]
MNEQEAQGRAREDQNEVTAMETEDKGPTAKLRDLENSKAGTLVPGPEVPGAQNPESEEIKREINPNTE